MLPESIAAKVTTSGRRVSEAAWRTAAATSSSGKACNDPAEDVDIIRGFVTIGSMPQSTDEILEHVRRAGVVRPRDLEAAGVPRVYLLRLERRGLLVRLARGLYALPDAPVTEHHSLVQAVKRAPGGVICLLSALRYHG